MSAPRKPLAVELPIYDSQSHCAGATGIPLAVLKHAKRNKCPAFRSNRVYLREFLEWYFSRDTADQGEDSGVDWKRERDKTATLRDRIRLEADRREVLHRSVVQEGITREVAKLFDKLDRNFCCDLPAVLKGLSEPEIKAEAVRVIERIKDEMRAGLDKLTPEPVAAPVEQQQEEEREVTE